MTDRRARQRTDDLPWIETTATVISSDYQETAWGPGVKERGESLNYFITKFSYRVNGVAYQGELRSQELRQLGSKFSIRYDPSNPSYNSVSKVEKPFGGRLLSWAFVVLGLIIFFLILRYLI